MAKCAARVNEDMISDGKCTEINEYFIYSNHRQVKITSEDVAAILATEAFLIQLHFSSSQKYLQKSSRRPAAKMHRCNKHAFHHYELIVQVCLISIFNFYNALSQCFHNECIGAISMLCTVTN